MSHIVAIKPRAITFKSDGSFTYESGNGAPIFPTKCNLSMQVNGIWSLDMEVPFDRELLPYIKEESIIAVSIRESLTKPLDIHASQTFRIEKVERTPKMFTVEAYQTFGDTGHCMVKRLHMVDDGPSYALSYLLQNYCGDTFGCDTHDIAEPIKTAYWEWKNVLECINGDEDNSFLNRWGGEFITDNHKILWDTKIDRFKAEPDNKLIRISAGLNMTGIEYTVDTSELITEVWAQAYNGRHYAEYITTPTDEDLEVDVSKPIYSPHFDDFAISYPSVIKYEKIKLKEDAGEEESEDITVCEDKKELYAALKEAVENDFSQNEIDVPVVTYDIDFTDLSQIKKYNGYEELITLCLGDSCIVYNEDLDIETVARVKEIEYDCVNEIVTKMILGDYKENYYTNQAKQNRVAGKVFDVSQGSASGEQITGVIQGNKSQTLLSLELGDNNGYQVVKIENRNASSSKDTTDRYGAIALGSDGLQVTRKSTKDYGGWDWDDSTILNAKGIFYGKLGNKNDTKYIQVNNDGLKSYDGGVSGQGITGTITSDSFSTVNGVVVGKSEWSPITYKISIVDNVLTLTDSNGKMSSVTLPETKTILTGDTGNGIKSAVLNDDYTLTLTWTNGENYTTPSIRGAQGIQGVQGEKGVKGDKGDKGDSTTITSYSVEYQEGTSSTQAPTSTWYTSPMDVLQGNYLWTRVTTNYSDGTIVKSYSIARYGVDGGQGATGKGISSVVAYYLATGLSSGVTKDTSGWTTSVQNVSSTKKYLWKYELTTWSNGDATSTNPIIIGTYGDKGDQGDPGKQGIQGETGADGKTSYIHIAYANSSDGKIGFSRDNPNGKSYIGHYVDYEADDSTDPTKYTWSKYVGDNGNGIESITNYYGVSTSADTQPSGWSTTVQSANKDNPYLWVYEVVTYTDGTTSETEPRVISIYTSQMSSMKPYYYLSTSNDANNFVEVDGNEWTDTIPTELSGTDSDGNTIQYYIWEKFIISMSDGTTKETDPTLYGLYTELDNKIDSTKNTLQIEINDVNSSVTQAKDNILSEVSSKYVLSDDLNQYKQEVSSSISQTNSSITTTIKELDSVSSKVGELESTAENVNSYMKFSADGLELGKSNSQFKTNLTNDKMSFIQSGNEVAYFSNNKMYVTDGEFTNSLHIGKFTFVPRANGSLDFKKVSD